MFTYKNFLTLIIVIFSLFSFSYGAKVGDSITNKVAISYKLCGASKEKKLEDVVFRVSATPATIEFLTAHNTYPQKANNQEAYYVTKELVQTSFYKDKNGTFHPIESAPLHNGVEFKPPARIELSSAEEYFLNDLIFIKVKDYDQNIHYDKIDTIEVTIINPYTNDKETILLQETQVNSGIFIGYIPSTNSTKELHDGTIYIQEGDKISASYIDGNQTLDAVVEDTAIVLEQTKSLFISKKANKKVVSAGDFVQYTITIENPQNYPIYNITLYDKLPIALHYEKNSLQIKESNTTFELEKQMLKLSLASIKANSKIELSYITQVGAKSKGSILNSAWVENHLGVISNIATASLELKNELYIDKGIIVGKVYNPKCNSSSCKYGIEGVRLYMEDGRYTLTDKEGKFHFIDVARGTHIIQIDPLSIAGRYSIIECKDSTAFAKRANSAFVEIKHSELKQINFCLKPIKTAKQSSLFNFSMEKKGNKVFVTLTLTSTTKLLNPEVYIKLPDGVEYQKTLQGKEALEIKRVLAVPMDRAKKEILLELNPYYPVNGNLEAILYYDTMLEQDQKSKRLVIHISKDSKKESRSQKLSNQSLEQGSKDFSWKKKQIQKSMPIFDEAMVDSLGKEPKIIWPPKGWVPSIPSTKIGILRPRGTTLELSLNGKRVSGLNYQKLYRNSTRTMQIDYYKGVDLAEGRNIIQALIKKNGKVIANLSQEIWVESHLPSKVEFLANESYLEADGKHTPIIAVRFLAKSGHPLRGGLVGSYKIEGEYEPYKKLNGKGAFKIEVNGVAYIRLKPTTKAGKVKLKFALLDNKVATIEARLKPNMREWFIVGFVEGSIGYKHLNSKIEPLDESKIETKGKVALFAKGMIKGKWLLTLAYDSTKEKKELFDRIDPEQYYLVYKDESIQKNEAASTKKLYVKIENDSFYALYGDYKTNLGDTKFANYNRSFTGLISEYEYKEWRAKAFLAKSDTIHYKEELRGDGTNGYYYLQNQYIIENSEKITIEIRDRLHPERVLETKTLSAYKDYTIDYDKGRIFFKEPIYSTSKELNPSYIIVEYDTDGENSNNYTYGGRVGYKGKRVEARITAIKEDNGNIQSSLVGIDSKIHITKSLELKAEYAKSTTTNESNTTQGDAKYLELHYKNKTTELKAWYQKESESFGLNNTQSSLQDTTQIGINFKKKLNKNFSANAEYYINKSNQSKTTRAQVEAEYKDSNKTITVGLREQKTDSERTNYLIASYTKKSKKFSYSLTHEQTLGGATKSNPTLSIFTTSYKKDENTTLSASLTREDSGDKTRWGSTFGVTYKPWENGEIALKRVMESYKESETIFDTLRLQQKFILGKYYNLTLGYEHGESVQGDNKNFDALNGVLNYSDKNRSAHLGLSGRIEGEDKKLSINTGYMLKVNSKQSIAFSANSNMRWSEDEIKRDSKVAFSYVYRPIKGNLVVLDKLEFKEEYEKKSNQNKSQTLKFINNLHLSYKKDKWEFGAQYGLKYLIDTIDSKRYSSVVDFIGLWAQYDILETLSIGTQFGLLHSYSANNLEYSFGIYLTKVLWENAEVILGYNLEGFKDDDFNIYNNYSNRLYLQFRIKFDQSDFTNITKRISK